MSKQFFIRVLAISLSVIMVLNLILLALRRMPIWFFWSIIVFCAIMAFFGIPLLNKTGR